PTSTLFPYTTLFRSLSIAALSVLGLGIYFLPTLAETPVHKGLQVHEWGVINVYNDVELANADMRSTWHALPKFVYGMVDQRHIPDRKSTRLNSSHLV